MNITKIDVYPVNSEGKTKALATITLEGCFVVSGMKVMQGSNGLFISMPSTKKQDGSFKDICYPLTAEFRETLKNSIIDAYNKKIGSSSTSSPVEDPFDGSPF